MEIHGNEQGPELLVVLRHALAICDHLHLRDVLNLRAACKGAVQCVGMPVRVLDCSHCLKLRQPPELPAFLTVLNCSWCASLEHLPDQLPAGLTHLDCSGCKRLERLPDQLPAGLTHLNCSA